VTITTENAERTETNLFSVGSGELDGQREVTITIEDAKRH
jgi:hypothetical protein